MGYTVIKDAKRACIVCNQTKLICDFNSYAYTTRQGKRSRRFSSLCRQCIIEKDKKRRPAGCKYNSDMSKRWRENNRDKHLQSLKEYRNSAHGKAVRCSLQRAREKKINLSSLTKEQKDLIAKIYTKAREMGPDYHVDHIIPISKGGTHTPENLQILTAAENRAKGAKMP